MLGGVEDFLRRSSGLHLLGDLVERIHSLPASDAAMAACAAAQRSVKDVAAAARARRRGGEAGGAAVLPLESPANVAAWLAARRVLKGSGVQFSAQFGIIAGVAVAFSVAQFAVTLLMLYLLPVPPPPPLGTHAGVPMAVAPVLVACADGVVLLALFLGLLVVMVRAGASANRTAGSHGELAVALRAEAARIAASIRSGAEAGGTLEERARATQWDDVAHLLEIVPKSLAYERALQVFGVDATDGLVSAILSAIISGASLVAGVLQVKFGFFFA